MSFQYCQLGISQKKSQNMYEKFLSHCQISGDFCKPALSMEANSVTYLNGNIQWNKSWHERYSNVHTAAEPGKIIGLSSALHHLLPMQIIQTQVIILNGLHIYVPFWTHIQLSSFVLPVPCFLLPSNSGIICFASTGNSAGNSSDVRCLQEYRSREDNFSSHSIHIKSEFRKIFWKITKELKNSNEVGKSRELVLREENMSTSVLANPAPVFWWERYRDCDVIALDVEMVTSIYPSTITNKCDQLAASIGVVDHNGDKLYFQRVFHQAGSFRVNKWTKKINGFQPHSLMDGQNIDKVRNEVMDILRGKLIITCGGRNDFRSLKINHGGFDVFDLQSYFRKRRCQFNRIGEIGHQPIGLRSLYHYYFQQDIHHGIHDPLVDAAATMRVFQEIYKPSVRDETMLDLPPPDFSRIPTIR